MEIKEDIGLTLQSSNFVCVLCNKTFDSKEVLQTHFRGHGSEVIERKKNFLKKIPEGVQCIQCDVCGSKFTSNTLAIQHKFKMHPLVGDKHICPTCGKSFTMKTLLEKHVTSHLEAGNSKKTKYPCSFCNIVFHNQSAKDYHVRTLHKGVMKLFQPIETAPPSKKIKVNNAGDIQSVYYCHICGSEYVVKFNLKKHLEDFHSEQERRATPIELIRCTACDAFFYNRKAYDVHNLGHKSSDLYVIDEEQRLNMVSRVDQDFDVRRVLPLSEKYIPTYRSKRVSYLSSLKVNDQKNKCEVLEDEEELSPPPSPGTSDSEPDTNSIITETSKPETSSINSH